MPETPVKESRRPELRLPEINRDEIVRAISEIRRPDVDLSRIQFPNIDVPDIRRAVEDAAVRVGVKERTRRRWPILAGFVIVLSLGAMTLLRRPAVRAQMEESAKKARARLEQLRLEREQASESLSVADIEAAVGEAGSNGHTPVAVGPGPKALADDAADAVSDIDDAASDVAADAADAVTDVADEAVAAAKDATA